MASIYGKNKKLKASICIGIAWGFFKWRKEFHSCNWVLLEDGDLYWIEPVNNTLHKLKNCKKGLRLMLV